MSPPRRRPRFAPDDLDDPALTRLILRLGLPAVAGLSINAIHHTINMFFVGMIGSHEIAAVTVVLPILMMVGAVGEGLGVGVATAVGRAIGAGDMDKANRTASTLLVLAVPIGLALTIGVLLFRHELLEQFGASATVLPLADRYLAIVAFSITFTMLQILADFIAISEGNTRFSMYTLMGCFGLNILLDPLMIFWLDFGLAGAGIATILSQLAALAAYCFYFRKRAGRLRVTARLARFRSDILVPVFSIGLPTTITSMLNSLSFALLFAFASSHGGDNGVAGVGIAMRILALGMLPVIGLSLGGQAVLSFAWGAGNFLRTRKASIVLLQWSSLFATSYAIVVIALRFPIATLFTDDPLIANVAAETIVAAHMPFMFFGVRQVLVVLLQAQARPRLAAAISIAQNGLFLLPLLFVLPRWFGFGGVLASVFAAPMIMAVVAIAVFIAVLREPRRGKNAIAATFNRPFIESAS